MNFYNFINSFATNPITKKNLDGNDFVQVKCPSHKDEKASLTITNTSEKILLHCHAGCRTEDILRTKNLTTKELFHGNAEKSKKRIKKKLVKTYVYTNEKNEPVHFVDRYKLEDGSKSFVQGHYLNGAKKYGLKNVDLKLYNLPNLMQAVKNNAITYIVEGEKDADNMNALGFVATTNNGGAKNWKERYNKYFQNAKVIIIADNDEAGVKHANTIYNNILHYANDVKIIQFLNTPPKYDVSDFLADNNNDPEKLYDYIENFNPNPQIQNKSILPYELCEEMLFAIPTTASEEIKNKALAGFVSYAKNFQAKATIIVTINKWKNDIKTSSMEILNYILKNDKNSPKLDTLINIALTYNFDIEKLKPYGNYVNDKNEVIFNETTYNSESGIKPEIEFWYEKELQNGELRLKISLVKFIEFLHFYGIRKYWVDNESSILVKMNDNIVEMFNDEKILDMTKEIIDKMNNNISNNFTKADLLEQIFKSISEFKNDKLLKMVNTLEGEFLKENKDTAYFPFKNGILKVTENSLELQPYINFDFLIWREDIIQRNYQKTKDNSGQFAEFIKLVCTSRPQINPLYDTSNPQWVTNEQKLLSLKTALGYLIHTYKDPALTKAVILCEEKIATGSEANGRTGKGLTAKALSYIRNMAVEDGRKIDTKSQFTFQNVTLATKIINLDDIAKKFDLGDLFSNLTENIEIRRLYKAPFKIPYENSPKFLISTNNVITNNSDSYKARKFEIEYTDFFNAEYTPTDHFGNRFFNDWTDKLADEWNKMDNFLIHCTQLFLINSLKDYDKINLDKRRLLSNVPEEFLDFCKQEEVINDLINHKKEVNVTILHQRFLVDFKDFGENSRYPTKFRTFKLWIEKLLQFENLNVKIERKSVNYEKNYVVLP